MLAVAAFIGSSGCVSAEHRAPQVSVPRSFDPYEAKAPDTALERWWLLFDDPQLNAFVEEALAKAPDSRTALAVLQEAREVRSAALARFDPQGGVNATGGGQRTTVVGTSVTAYQGLYSGSFSPSWEIDLFGRRAAARRTADADLDAARFTYESARQSLEGNVAGDLFEVRADEIRLAQARETLRIASELARIGERRVVAGIGARADAASLQADEATAAAQVRALATRLEISKRTLLVLLGRGTEPVEAVQVSTASGKLPPIPAAAPATLLARRPDIRLAEARLLSVAGTLDLDARALLPTFSLLPSLSQGRTTGVGGYTTSLWSIAAGIALPVLDRHRLLAEVRGQRARVEQAVIAYENAVQAGFGEAQSNLALYGADAARLQSLSRAEERSRTAFEAQRTGYTAGVVDLTALLQAERTWRTNLAALTDLHATALTDAVNLFRSLGGGWPASATLGPATAPRSNSKDDR